MKNLHFITIPGAGLHAHIHIYIANLSISSLAEARKFFFRLYFQKYNHFFWDANLFSSSPTPSTLTSLFSLYFFSANPPPPPPRHFFFGGPLWSSHSFPQNSNCKMYRRLYTSNWAKLSSPGSGQLCYIAVRSRREEGCQCGGRITWFNSLLPSPPPSTIWRDMMLATPSLVPPSLTSSTHSHGTLSI